MIKKTILLFSVVLTLSACSSGTSVSDLPPSVGASFYTGTFVISDGRARGTVNLDLSDDGSGNITGNMIVNDTVGNSCLCSNEVTGTQTGFDITLETADCFVEARPRDCDNRDEDTGLCPLEEFSGPTNITLTGNATGTLNGTFIVQENLCLAPVFSTHTNTGTMNLSR